MSQSVFALVDGNSFYASCQIAFQPALVNRPVVVLSNNDGCIVAANQLAKNLNAELMAKVGSLGAGGYKSAMPTHMMFQPYFKVKWLLNKHNAAVFSSNYELYGDMSNRMHSITSAFAPRQEIYSIDESFLDLTGLDKLYNLSEYGQTIKHKVQKDIGIPVAVGIAPTKTLAKLANHLAKKLPGLAGVLDLCALPSNVLDAYLSQVKVGSVWGIGRQLSQKLNADGIETVSNLKKANLKRIRKKYGIVVERMVRELNGESCLSLEAIYAAKKQIISSRSFGQNIVHYAAMEQAVSSFACRAAEKLRRQNSACHFITVFIQTSPFTQTPHYKNSFTVPLIYPSNNSILLTKLAKRALKHIWRPGLAYQKAGVMVSEVKPVGPLQTDIFAQNPQYSANEKQAKLMQVMDSINLISGKGAMFLASQGAPQHTSWKMNRNLMSPRFTSRWDELLVVH